MRAWALILVLAQAASNAPRRGGIERGTHLQRVVPVHVPPRGHVPEANPRRPFVKVRHPKRRLAVAPQKSSDTV